MMGRRGALFVFAILTLAPSYVYAFSQYDPDDLEAAVAVIKRGTALAFHGSTAPMSEDMPPDPYDGRKGTILESATEYQFNSHPDRAQDGYRYHSLPSDGQRAEPDGAITDKHGNKAVQTQLKSFDADPKACSKIGSAVATYPTQSIIIPESTLDYVMLNCKEMVAGHEHRIHKGGLTDSEAAEFSRLANKMKWSGTKDNPIPDLSGLTDEEKARLAELGRKVRTPHVSFSKKAVAEIKHGYTTTAKAKGYSTAAANDNKPEARESKAHHTKEAAAGGSSRSYTTMILKLAEGSVPEGMIHSAEKVIHVTSGIPYVRQVVGVTTVAVNGYYYVKIIMDVDPATDEGKQRIHKATNTLIDSGFVNAGAFAGGLAGSTSGGAAGTAIAVYACPYTVAFAPYCLVAVPVVMGIGGGIVGAYYGSGAMEVFVEGVHEADAMRKANEEYLNALNQAPQ